MTDRTPKAVAQKAVWFDIQDLTSETLDAFLDWQRDARIFPMRGTTFSGPASVGPHRVHANRRVFTAGFYASDADAVTRWLVEHGVPVTIEE